MTGRLSNIDALEVRILLSATGGDHDHGLKEFLDSDFQLNSISLTQPGQLLSSPKPGDPFLIAEQFLESQIATLGLSAGELDFRVGSSSVSEQSGTTHIYLQQTLNGLDILNAVANVSVAKSGAIVSAGSSFVATAGGSVSAVSAISATQALESFVTKLGIGVPKTVTSTFFAAHRVPANVLQHGESDVYLLSALEITRNPIPAEPVLIPTKDGLEPGWRLNVQMDDGSHWFDAGVSSVDGDVLSISDWVSDARYNVFAAPKESPSDGGRTNLLNPQNAVSSPFGWHDTNGVVGAEFTTTNGNNVQAYTDIDANNIPDAGSAPDGTAALLFNFPLDLAQVPSTYRSAAVTNLFYANNFIHDVTYHHGFNEASGNFQVANYSGSGTGGDPVNAEAQDGAGTNNANFATPPDGTSPRMQMFNWTLTTPARDGDFDNGIIYHEYGHGISNRLTGGPANSSALTTIQSGGMGEGWSDFWALMLTQTSTDSAGDARGIGTYALGQPSTGPGIRTQPYSYDFADNDHTFGDLIGSNSVHFVGETWATTLWDLNWALIQGNALDPALPNAGHGFTSNFHTGDGGNTELMKLVLEGMKLQPVNPSFLQARDAILQADMTLNGGQNQETIWRVFARRGMGFSATDSGSSNTNVTEAFDLPIFNTFTIPNRILPGSQVSRVTGGLATPLAAAETRVLRFFGEANSRITLTLTPNNPATVLTGTLRKADGTLVAGPVVSAPGQPVEFGNTLLTANNNYRVVLHSTLTSGISLDAVRNAALESQFGDSTATAEVNLNNSLVNVGARRHAVIGQSTAGLTSSRQSLPSGFVDISTTGTPLNLGDDGETLITTTVGNSLLPAGTVVVGNNGGLLKRNAVTDLGLTNAALTSAFAGLFPFWDDIDSDAGNVYWDERQVGGVNTLIVQWHNRPHYSNVGSTTFQVQVFATGTTLVRFAYQDVDFGNASFDNGASATIGIVSPTGVVSEHSFNTANSVLSGDVIDYAILADVDEYEFTGVAGETIGVIFDGLNGVNMRNATVQLKRGATLLATAVSNPLSAGVTATNFDLGISAFVLPANAVYTIRIVGRTRGEYVTLITRNAAFNTENSGGSLAPSPRIRVGLNALGFLNAANDTADHFVLNVTSGQTIQIDLDRPFDHASSLPLNSLTSLLQLRTLTGTLLANSTNSGPGGLPRITYTATSTGDLRLNVSRLTGIGEYIIRIEQLTGIQRGSGLANTSAVPTIISAPKLQLSMASKSQPLSFRWTNVSGAQAYSLWVSRISESGAATTAINVTQLTKNSFTPTAPLSPGKYRVWLRTIGTGGLASNWSEHVDITI